MATIVTRSGKGSPLTHAEMDANLTNLNTDKLEVSVHNTYVSDLASTTSGKGAALIGRAAMVVPSISALRELLKTSVGQHAYVAGYYAQGDGGGGAYWYDSTDTTSADNGGTIIVATDGGRWKLVRATTTSVKQFGAKGDGTTDDTQAFLNAVAALGGGGNLFVPSGKYRLTDRIPVPAGLSISGAGAADNVYGAPPATASVPAYLFQTTPGKSIFYIGGGLSGISISRLAMGASETIVANMTPVADGRYGIECAGSYPQFSWFMRFEDLLFYDLERGISIVDPNSGTESPPFDFDWNCAPIKIVSCRFLYPLNGLYIDSNNVDCLLVDTCVFSIPSGGKGINAQRWGYLHFINCNGGGAAISNNAFAYFRGNGVSSADDVVFDHCQSESLTHSIFVDALCSPIYRFTIECRNFIAEMGSDVYLGGNVHFVSRKSRWNCGVYTDDVDVRISSYDDNFIGGGQFWFLVGGPSTTLVNFEPGPNTKADYVGMRYVGGVYRGFGDAAPVAGTWAVGDTQYNSVPDIGMPVGWIYEVGGTWQPFGQVGSRIYNGNPIGNITPYFVGEELLSSATGQWYKSVGTGSTSWVVIG